MIDLSGKRNSRKAYNDVRNTPGKQQGVVDSIWHWLNGVADGVAYYFTGKVSFGFHTILDAIHTLVDGYKDFIGTFARLTFWIQIHVLKYLFSLIMAKYNKAIAALKADVRYLVRLIYVTTNQVLALAMHAIRRERSDRIRAINRAEAQAKLEVRALHSTIEREAASAYRVEYQGRVNLIVRLLEFAVTRNPELRDVVGVLVRGVLDLIAVDDPLVRIALGFAIRDVIDKLGIDRLVGQAVGDLLEPLLGNPKPRDLHAVVEDMGKRLVAAESFSATFTEDGGSQVEQAGRLWRDITQPAIAASMVGFITLAVRDPDGWAKVLTNTVGRLGTDLIDGTAKLVKEA